MTTPTFTISRPDDYKSAILVVVSSGTSVIGVRLAIAGCAFLSPALLTLAIVSSSVALGTKLASRHAERSSN